MEKPGHFVKAMLVVIALLLGVIALRPYVAPDLAVSAQSARYDHIYIAASGFLYKGQQGLLVMDKRNANIWFIPRANDRFLSPVFLLQLPLDKLDDAPQ